MSISARTGRTVAATVALMLLVLAGGFTNQASANPVDDADPTIIARGVLRNASGQPTAGSVQALAWPDDVALSALGESGDVNLAPIAATEVGSDGNFVLRMGSDIPLGGLIDATAAEAVINVTLVGTAGDDFGVHATFRRYQVNVGALALPLPSDLIALEPIPVIDLQMGIGNSSAVETTGIETADEAALEPENDAVILKSCTTTLVKRLPLAWGLVGEVHNGPTSTAVFTYTNGASSALGVGASATNKEGSWRLHGESSRSSTATVGFGRVAKNTRRYHFTGWEEAKFFIKCMSPNKHWWEVRTTKFAGGTRAATPPSGPAMNHCAPYNAGSFFTRQQNKAAKWSNGLKTGGSIGIDLTIQTGYSSAARIRYDFTGPSWLCGNNAHAGTSSRIASKAR